MNNTILTNIGRQKFLTATPENQIEIKKIILGDGGGAPIVVDPDMTWVVNEVESINVSLPIRYDYIPDTLVFEGVSPASKGGYTIREIGLVDADGDLVAIGSTPTIVKPAPENGGIEVLFRPYLKLDNASDVDLIIYDSDPKNHSKLINRDAPDSHPASAISYKGTNVEEALESLENFSADLTNPNKGAAMVARGVVAVDSIADLLALPEGQRREGLQYSVASFYEGKNQGGGVFVWEEDTNKSTANGGTVIDPDNLGGFDGTAASIGSFLAAQGTGSGSGCFVRVGVNWGSVSLVDFGADTSGLHDSSAALQKYIDSVQTGVTNEVGGGVVNIPNGFFKISTPVKIKRKAIRILGEGRGSYLFIDRSHFPVDGAIIQSRNDDRPISYTISASFRNIQFYAYDPREHSVFSDEAYAPISNCAAIRISGNTSHGEYTSIEFCTFKGFTYGIHGVSWWAVQIKHNVFTCKRGVGFGVSFRNDSLIDATISYSINSVTIEDNWFVSLNHGIRTGDQSVNSLRIVKNTFEASSTGYDGLQSNSTIIEDNYFEGVDRVINVGRTSFREGVEVYNMSFQNNFINDTSGNLLINGAVNSVFKGNLFHGDNSTFDFYNVPIADAVRGSHFEYKNPVRNPSKINAGSNLLIEEGTAVGDSIKYRVNTRKTSSSANRLLLSGAGGLLGSSEVVEDLGGTNSPFSGTQFLQTTPSTLNSPASEAGAVLFMSPQDSVSGRGAMLYISTNSDGKAYIRRKGFQASWRPWIELLNTANTTIDQDGIVRGASPIIRLFDDRIETDIDGAYLVKKGTGVYEIHGTCGLSQDGWYLSTPSNRNGDKYFNVDWEQQPAQTDDNSAGEVVTIRVYERLWNPEVGRFENGAPLDIGENIHTTSERFITLRMQEMYPAV